MPFFKRKQDKQKEKINDKSGTQVIQGAMAPDPFIDGATGMPKALLLRTYSELYTNDSSEPAEVHLTSSSRLSKTLHELLHDRDALPHLTHFLQARGAQALLRFWLDAESFQASAVTRVRSHSQLSLSKSGSKTDVNLTARTDNYTHPKPIDKDKDFRDKTAASQEKSNVSNAETSHTNNRERASRGGMNSGSLCSNPLQHPSSSDSRTSETNPTNFVSTGPGSSQGKSDVTTQSINMAHTPVVSNSSAHGGTAGAIMSQTPPRASPCEAATSDLEGLHRPTAKCQEVAIGKDKNTTSQNKTKSAIITPNNSGCNPQPVAANMNENSIKELDHNASKTSAISIKKDAVASSESGETSVISPPTPSNQISVTTANQHDGQSVKRGASKQSLQEKLLSNIASDAVRIFSRYVAQDATHPIGVTDELRQECIRKICREDGLVDPHSFVPCQEFAVQKLQQKYYSEFMASENHCQHQIDLLTGSTVLLSDVLYNDTALSYFTEFMELEGAVRLLQCWLDLENFQQFLLARPDNADWLEAQDDAMVIYDKYFSLQARQPLGFEDKVRFEVEMNICREGGPRPDCFTKPKAIVTTALNKGYFPQYLQSEVYFKYLSDLINTVQLSQDLPSMPLKRKESDTSSQHSGHSEHTPNTLLAGGRKVATAAAVTPTVGKAISKLEPDMQIENALLNPDTLWQRPISNSLSLARIDEMGRFVSDFESQPDHEKGAFAELGIFKRGKEKEKAQADMALQVANRIISDITGTTQPQMQLHDTFRSDPVPK